MWSKIASILLRYRFAVLIALGGMTVFMATYIPKLRLVYEFGDCCLRMIRHTSTTLGF